MRERAQCRRFIPQVLHRSTLCAVPIEIGPTFLLKAGVRRLAACRGLSDYRYYERYTLRHAMRMLFAGRRSTVDRPVITLTWRTRRRLIPYFVMYAAALVLAAPSRLQRIMSRLIVRLCES